MGEKVTASSVPKSDSRVEFELGFPDEILRTSLMLVWEMIKPSSWSPSPNVDMILRGFHFTRTQDIEREFNVDCNLRELHTMHNLMIEASRSSRE